MSTPGSTAGPLLAPEYAFALVGLVLGLLLAFANPPWQGNDEDRHFYNAYFHSIGQSAMQPSGGQVGGFLPADLIDVVSMYQGIAFSPTVKISRTRLKQASLVPLLESRTVFYDNPNWGVNPVGYLPHVAGIAVARVVNSNPLHLLWGARIGGLLAYLAIVFAAIRIVPAHKWVLFAVALTPMALYQATSVTYDTLCIALSFLIVALAVRFALRDRPISQAELALFLAVALLQRFAKDGYFLLPFLFFLVPQKNIGSRGKTAAIFVAICAIGALPLVTWDAWVASLQLQHRAALQKDFLFDAWRQLDFYRHQPGAFAAYLLLNVAAQAKEWIIGTVGRFGYAYAALPQYVVFVHGLALLSLSILDGSGARALTPRERLVVAIVGFGSAALIIVGTFVRGSPVGAHVIFGLQGRYFLPIVPVILLVNCQLCCASVFAERWKSVVVPVYSAGVLAYSLHFINAYFYRA